MTEFSSFEILLHTSTGFTQTLTKAAIASEFALNNLFSLF